MPYWKSHANMRGRYSFSFSPQSSIYVIREKWILKRVYILNSISFIHTYVYIHLMEILLVHIWFYKFYLINFLWLCYSSFWFFYAMHYNLLIHCFKFIGYWISETSLLSSLEFGSEDGWLSSFYSCLIKKVNNVQFEYVQFKYVLVQKQTMSKIWLCENFHLFHWYD